MVPGFFAARFPAELTDVFVFVAAHEATVSLEESLHRRR